GRGTTTASTRKRLSRQRIAIRKVQKPPLRGAAVPGIEPAPAHGRKTGQPRRSVKPRGYPDSAVKLCTQPHAGPAQRLVSRQYPQTGVATTMEQQRARLVAALLQT